MQKGSLVDIKGMVGDEPVVRFSTISGAETITADVAVKLGNLERADSKSGSGASSNGDGGGGGGADSGAHETTKKVPKDCEFLLLQTKEDLKTEEPDVIIVIENGSLSFRQ